MLLSEPLHTQAIPNWLTTVLLAILLTVLTWKLSSRGFMTWRKETADAQKLRDSAAAQPLLQDAPGEHVTHHHIVLQDAFRSNGALACLHAYLTRSCKGRPNHNATLHKVSGAGFLVSCAGLRSWPGCLTAVAASAIELMFARPSCGACSR